MPDGAVGIMPASGNGARCASLFMAHDPTSTAVIRLLRDAHHNLRPDWYNFDTITAGAQYRILHRLCRKWIPAGGRVLDWGPGTGHASVYLTRSGFKVTGYSLKEGFSFGDLLGAAPYRFVAGEASEPVLLPFEDGEFDAVLSVGVLEHVREVGGNEAASLREIYRVLRPGGVMICTYLPNAGSWIEAFVRSRGIGDVHKYRYTPEEARAMFEDAGFKIERYGRHGILPRNRLAHVLPRKLCDSEGFSRFYDVLDAAGSVLLPWFVQNHLVVAQRPAA